MDSQQLLDYLYRAKADLNRGLESLKAIAPENGVATDAVCETEKWLQCAREDVLKALEHMAEFDRPDDMEDIAAMFNESAGTEGAELYGADASDMWLHFSKACEIALHLGRISVPILVNRLDITPTQADYLITKLVEEEIIPDLQNGSGEYIIF
ncbi:MAG: hypothetical protein E7031_02890 [Akkermansiaceae bacterium]|nr:hypothetical protein [Akkermansiaceae bacterium]